MITIKRSVLTLFTAAIFIIPMTVFAQEIETGINLEKFTIASVIGFFIKGFFIVAALAALIFLLLGAFAWITSSGDKEGVKKAQDKIQAAVVGLLVVVAAVAIMATLEQFVFQKKICIGLTCELKIPSLVEPATP